MAITLGLVEAVDDNGVYVSMPGSRGVLRGPYKALSTVAAGTTVLVASTDDGEQVVVGPTAGGDGFVSVLSFGAVGDGATDDTEAIQAAFDAYTGGGAVVFPAGYTFRITDSITPPDLVTVWGYGATLRMDTKHTPCFDIVMKDDVTILGLSFLTEIDRTYTGEFPPSGTRGNDPYAYWAGVLASGERLTVRDCSFRGFTVGVYLYTWNGTDLTGHSTEARVLDCTFHDNDFGVLTETADDFTLRGIRGSWSQQTGSPNPPHLIYLSGTPGNTNVTISDVYGYDSPDGHCVQVKYTTGGTVTNVRAHGCSGVLSLRGVSDVAFSDIVSTSEDGTSSGSIYMTHTDNDRVSFANVYIESVDPTPDGMRAGHFKGSNITVSDVTSMFHWDDLSDTAEWEIASGTNVTLDGLTSINSTTYGGIALGVTDSPQVSVTNVRAINCRGGVYWLGTSTGTLDINTDHIIPGSSIGSPVTYQITTPSNVNTCFRSESAVGFYGTTPIAKPTVTGSRGGNAALASLLTELANLGLITDSSS